MYAAALISADSITKPESAGLLAHMFSILQLVKDLGGSQWLHYDKSFSKKCKELGRSKLTNILSVHGIPAKSSTFFKVAQALSQDSRDARHGILREHTKGQDLGSPTAAATTVEDLIEPPTVHHSQRNVLVSNVDKANISDFHY